MATVQLFCSESLADFETQPSHCSIIPIDAFPPAVPAITANEALEEFHRLRQTEELLKLGKESPQKRGRPITREERHFLIRIVYTIAEELGMPAGLKARAVYYMDKHLGSGAFKVGDFPVPVVLAISYLHLAAKFEDSSFERGWTGPWMQRHAASVPYAQLAVTEMRVLKAMNWRMAGHTVADVLPPVVHMLEPAINSTALPCGQSKDIIKLILDTALDICLQALAEPLFAALQPSQLALSATLITIESLSMSQNYHHGKCYASCIHGCVSAVVQLAANLLDPQEISHVCEIQDMLFSMLQQPSADLPCQMEQQEVAPVRQDCPASPKMRFQPGWSSPRSVLCVQTYADSESGSELDSPYPVVAVSDCGGGAFTA